MVEGGVGRCRRKFRVCVTLTVSGKGVEMMRGLSCVCMCVWVCVWQKGRGVGEIVCMCCGRSTLDMEPSSDSSEENSDVVSHARSSYVV